MSLACYPALPVLNLGCGCPRRILLLHYVKNTPYTLSTRQLDFSSADIHSYCHRQGTGDLRLDPQPSTTVYAHIAQHIAKQYHIPASSIHIIKTPQGKPQVFITQDAGHSPLAHCYISISHAYHQSVWMVATTPCALDLEYLQPRRHLSQLVARLCASIHAHHPLSRLDHPEQLFHQWQQLAPCLQQHCFYAFWTFAEAWCKWHGNTLWQTFQQGLPFPWPSWQALAQCREQPLGPLMHLSFTPTHTYLLAVLRAASPS